MDKHTITVTMRRTDYPKSPRIFVQTDKEGREFTKADFGKDIGNYIFKSVGHFGQQTDCEVTITITPKITNNEL